jgi:hypothetical protein
VLADMHVVLACHPGTQSNAVREVHARVRRLQDGALGLGFSVEGDLARLRVPPPSLPRRTDRLWQHTCFEAFIAAKGKAAYREFNFAPSGEWAAYSFRRYRDGAPLAQELTPEIAVRRSSERLELDAVVFPIDLPPGQAQGALRLALSAVLEEQGGALSYWALKHPPGKPDFHHRDAFALELAPAGIDAVTRSAVEDKR